MMNGLYYLLEANLYLAVFYGFYRLFLHNETFYTLNRYYLIAATVLAFTFPLLQLGYLYNLIGLQTYTDPVQKPATETNMQSGFSPDLIVYAYIAVSAVFLGVFFVNLYHIILRVVQNPKLRIDNVIYVELPGSETAFSFFNLLFINPVASNKNTIIRHELVHIHQKHSADILFFEMVRILGWFNPITYLLQKEIKLLHEYIADDVTTNAVQKHEYAMFLIQNSFGVAPNQLSNQIFNQSILKMRINMLNKERSAGRARLRLLLVLPLVGGMLCASTMAFTKDYATVDLYPKEYRSIRAVDQDTLQKGTATAKKSVTVKPVPPPPPAPPAPPAAKKINSTTQRKDMVRFPPPIVVPNKKIKSKAAEKRQVKFPKPILTDKKVKFPKPVLTDKKNEVPPPPPVEMKKNL